MAESLGTTAGIVGLVGAAITVVQQIRKARESVKGASKTLEHLSSILNAISDTLELVGQEPRLQTIDVEDQIRLVNQHLVDLKEFFEKLQAKFQQGRVQNYIHALRTGDADDNELAKIIGRLDGARFELLTRISVVHVGLTGSIDDGFRVAFGILEETNSRVRQILGLNLALATRLQNRELIPAGSGFVALEASDIVALKLDGGHDPDAQPQSSRRDTTPSRNGNFNLNWEGNSTLDEPRIFVGNLGVEELSNMSDVRSNVTHSTFGKGLRLMNGDVVGEAANNFAESFFKT